MKSLLSPYLALTAKEFFDQARRTTTPDQNVLDGTLREEGGVQQSLIKKGQADPSQIPGVFKGSITRPSHSFTGIEGGVPRGALSEFSGKPGSGKTEITLRFLAENPELRVAWIEETFTAYPCAFAQNEVELGRFLFIDTCEDQKETLWSAHQIIRSQIFGVVVLSFPSLSHLGKQAGAQNELRRLQLAAEKSQITVILLTEIPSRAANWPIALQVEVHRSRFDQKPEIRILKSRGQNSWQSPESRVCS